MTIQLHEVTPVTYGPHATRLDGMLFVCTGPEQEGAYRGASLVGDLFHDEVKDVWKVRVGDDEAYSPVRCRAEARARIVSEFRRGLRAA